MPPELLRIIFLTYAPKIASGYSHQRTSFGLQADDLVMYWRCVGDVLSMFWQYFSFHSEYHTIINLIGKSTTEHVGRCLFRWFTPASSLVLLVREGFSPSAEKIVLSRLGRISAPKFVLLCSLGGRPSMLLLGGST